MSDADKISLYDYLYDTQWIFATWGVFGAFSLYLLDFLGRFSDTTAQLLPVVNNVSTRTSTDISNYMLSGTAAALFQIAVASSFILFLLITIVLSQKCVDYIGRGFFKSVQEEKLYYETIVLLIFFVCFLFLLGSIAVFVAVKFLNTIVVIEAYYVVIFIFLIGLFITVIMVKRHEKKKAVAEQEKALVESRKAFAEVCGSIYEAEE